MGSFPAGAFLASLPFTVLAVLVVLGVTFVVALRVGKHAVVDVAWGTGFAVVALTALVSSAADGAAGRRFLVVAMTVVWGLRLAGHIALRSRGQGEDPRYEELMAKAPGNPNLHAFRTIYLTQGTVMWLVSLPVQVAVFEHGAPGPLAYVGAVVWLVGFGFETVGDLQLTRFRNDPSSTGQVLDSGLWRYTRHPNYFGDACVWWGISLVAFDAWPGVLTVLSPLLMTWLLAKGTGKPLLEKDMSSRRPGYADYVRRTSGFVPLPPKRTRAVG
jgi:steroid 5-alpha reductase family enzyme